MQNAGASEQVVMAELAGYGKGFKARIKMLDVAAKLSDGNNDQWEEDAYNIAKELLNKPTMTENDVRTFMEKNLKMGFLGAKAAVELVKARDSGDPESLKQSNEDIKKFKKERKDALKTESTKMDEIKKLMNEWKVGQRLVGQGLFGLAMDAAAFLIAYFKSVGTLVGTYLNPSFEAGRKERAALMDKVAYFGRHAPEHAQQVIDGMEKSGDVVVKATKSALGTSVVAPVLEAFNHNPYETITEFESKGNVNWGAEGSRHGTTPITKVVTVSVPAKGDITPHSVDLLNPTDEYYQAAEEYGWTGGQLSLVTYGVTESGDIKMGLEGSCPRCGLLYTRNSGLNDTSMESLDWDGENSIMNPKRDSVLLPSVFTDADNAKLGPAPSDRPSVKREIAAAAKDSEQVDLLTTLGMSEMGARHLKTKEGRRELAGVLYTVLNRLGGKTENLKKDREEHGKFRENENLRDVILGNATEMGKQGGKRPYATSKGEDKSSSGFKAMRSFVQDILAGKVANPVGGATHFVHGLQGHGYNLSHKKTKENRAARKSGGRDVHSGRALAHFQEDAVNIVNMKRKGRPMARFYAYSGAEASDKELYDAKQISSWEEEHGKTWVPKK